MNLVYSFEDSKNSVAPVTSDALTTPSTTRLLNTSANSFIFSSVIFSPNQSPLKTLNFSYLETPPLASC